MADNVHYLGSFNLDENKLVISDPSIPLKETNNLISPVKTGKWNAYVGKREFVFGDGKRGERCTRLNVYHESLSPDKISGIEWEKGQFDIGIDTGQVGVFSPKVFRNDDILDNKPKFDTNDPWYDMCCDITLGNNKAGVVKGGVVSSSGFGDGYYDFKYSTDSDDNINAVTIIFIGEEENQ